MKAYNKSIGSFGEDLAVNYITNLGYIILQKNFKCKIGEIDIVAKDSEYVVFIEVKTRYNSKYGLPCEAVTPYKQKKIYKTAQFYIMINKMNSFNFRFDVIEVILDYNCPDNHIRLIKNAFIV
jgi:putative endonuclease